MNNLPVFYYFWPSIMLAIHFFSHCQIALLPFLVSSFIIVIRGRFKYRLCKIMVLAADFMLLAVYLLFMAAYLWINPQKEMIETVYSPDKKYIMVAEESEFFTGGQVYVYAGWNLDFGVLGHYRPVKVKYYGNTGERPGLQFMKDGFICINGQRIEIEGSDYMDDYD